MTAHSKPTNGRQYSVWIWVQSDRNNYNFCPGDHLPFPLEQRSPKSSTRTIMEKLKSASPQSPLRYFRLLYFIPAIAGLCVIGYCIWQIFPYFLALIIAGPIVGYSFLQILPLFLELLASRKQT